MRYSFAITTLSFLSSAFAITVTSPSSDSVWDFSTAKTIKFTSDSSDPPVISIILRTRDGSFQTKLADNVKTSDGEYTTQPNPSISNGYDYEIQIIDSAGQLAVSDIFTVKKGASNDGTTSSSSSSSSSATPNATTSISVTFTLKSSASLTLTTSTSPLFSSGRTTSSSSSSSSSTSFSTTTTTFPTSSDTSSTSTSASTLHSTGTASSPFSAPIGVLALLGATLALFYV